MGWYTVTTTINGRKYLYLQLTYREGGKVKCKNKYLGPAASYGASFGFGAPANLPISDGKPVKPHGRLKLDKIRRIRPTTLGEWNRDAALRRFKEEASANLVGIKEDREAGLDVSERQEIDRVYRET